MTILRPRSGQIALIGPNSSHNAHWQLAGTTNQNGGLAVHFTGLTIVQQNGQPGQVNPPVNLYGSRIQVSGDFSLKFILKDVRGTASIDIYGSPPIIEDEWRAEHGSLFTTLGRQKADATLEDQVDNIPSAHASAAIPDASSYNLTISHIGNRIAVSVDGKPVGSAMPDEGIFNTGQVWLGFDAADANSSFIVTELDAAPANGGKLSLADSRQVAVEQSPLGFAALARQKRPDVKIGAAAALGPIVADAKYDQLLANFNSITTENVGKFQFIHPLPGNNPNSYNFTDMDALVEIAHQTGMSVHGHALIFGEANPAWLQDIAKLHPEQLEQIMVSHIHTIVGRYRGRVESWDVINEPLADYGSPSGIDGLRHTIWYDAIGSYYLAIALKAAHDADPAATLWINDFGMESDTDRFDQMLLLVQQLRQSGAPLTGIGFEAHIDDGDTINGDSHIDTSLLHSRIRTLASLGLKMRFSELDVSSSAEYPVFTDIYRTCLSEPSCTGVTTWGITDKYSSSTTFEDNNYRPGIGLPWDEHMQPLPPVRSILNFLTGY